MISPADAKSVDSGARLIEAAFEVARQQGRDYWRTMTDAVLKNRILDLTDRSFREQDYGATSFRGFLRLFSNLVDVDATSNPAVVRWIGGSGEESALAVAGSDFRLGPHRRIRDDLWTAVLDYSSGQAYHWDGQAAVTDGGGGSDHCLPTLTREEFAAWRAEFVDRASAENPMAEKVLAEWRASEAGTAALPRKLRWIWIGELKARVLSRLLDWFREQGIDPPPDLVLDAAPHSPEDTQTEEIRELVLKCVQLMSRPQLEEMRLPPDVVIRARAG
jgi:hypothetical protein